jgi:hypothetical protein
LSQTRRVGPCGRIQELAELQMHADDVRAQPTHLGKISGHGIPVGLPIVFEESTVPIVIVIQTPHAERIAGCGFEAGIVGRNANRLQLIGLGSCGESDQQIERA